MKFKQRIYEDYFKPSRLFAYRKVLELLRDSEYRMVGVLDFYNIVQREGSITGKYFINRHDIDTSPRVAREMFCIEKEVFGKGGSATYYFRDSTIDRKLISEIDEYGYETGYHYEEIATYEKKHKTRSKTALEQAMPQIREEFEKDLENFR